MKFRLFLGLVAVSVAAYAAAPKYVFLFIGDGMSTPQRMVAEEFSRATGTGPLAMNALPYQCTTRTRAANAVITDSAAAATAIACGEKANNGALGITPDGRRLESVAELAKKRGCDYVDLSDVFESENPEGRLMSRLKYELIDGPINFYDAMNAKVCR